MTMNTRPSYGSHRPDGYPQQDELPVGYLQRGYFDEKGNLLPQVLEDWPQEIAQNLFHANPKMTTSQLRGAFFNEVRRIENKLDATHDFDAIKPELLKLKAYAEDRKKKNKVPQLFEKFIEANLRWATRSEKDFRQGFVNHFECVVAYYPEVRGN